MFDRLKRAMPDERGLLATETIWPAIAPALQACTKLADSDLPPYELRRTTLITLARYLIHKKSSSHFAVPVEWKEWSTAERKRLGWLSIRAKLRPIFDGFCLFRKLRKVDLPVFLSSCDSFVELQLDQSVLPETFDFGGFEAAVVSFKNKDTTSLMDPTPVALIPDLNNQPIQTSPVVEKVLSSIFALKQDPGIQKILSEGYFLTGYPLEAPPNELPITGSHVVVLWDLVKSCGFSILRESRGVGDGVVSCNRWCFPLSRVWAAIQRALQTEPADGIVKPDLIQKILVLADENGPNLTAHEKIKNFLIILKNEWLAYTKTPEATNDTSFNLPSKMIGLHLNSIMTDAHDPLLASPEIYRFALSFSGSKVEAVKPSLATLCQLYGIPPTRMGWLHNEFKALIEGGEDRYPDEPASLSKDQTKELLLALEPDLEGFDAKWTKIDRDGSGGLEFDEFVELVSLSGDLESI